MKNKLWIYSIVIVLLIIWGFLVFKTPNVSTKLKFTPNSEYQFGDTIYNCDSLQGIVTFYGAFVGEDTTYFYGVICDSAGVEVRRIFKENEILK